MLWPSLSLSALISLSSALKRENSLSLFLSHSHSLLFLSHFLLSPTIIPFLYHALSVSSPLPPSPLSLSPSLSFCLSTNCLTHWVSPRWLLKRLIGNDANEFRSNETNSVSAAEWARDSRTRTPSYKPRQTPALHEV